jgi:hypothetical protein
LVVHEAYLADFVARETRWHRNGHDAMARRLAFCAEAADAASDKQTRLKASSHQKTGVLIGHSARRDSGRMADVAGMQHTVGETLFSIGQIPRSEPGFLFDGAKQGPSEKRW